MNKSQSLKGQTLLSKYLLEKNLGEGSFGKIYKAINIKTNETFAIKIEEKSLGKNLLQQEAYAIHYLKGGKVFILIPFNLEGIPKILSFAYTEEYNLMIMEQLGKSLQVLFRDNGNKFSLKTVCMIGHEMIQRIEYVHSKNLLHRDIKPDNFVIGLGEEASLIYLIDFGLVKKYRRSKTMKHKEFGINKRLTGNAKYSSVNALQGYEQSRRDDLESIGYVLIYFLTGSLPWELPTDMTKVDMTKDDLYKIIAEEKKITTPQELCEGLPKEFEDYITYTRNLDYYEDPDYDYLKGLMAKIMKDNEWEFDYYYDWILSKCQVIEKTCSSSFELKQMIKIIDEKYNVPKHNNNDKANFQSDKKKTKNVKSRKINKGETAIIDNHIKRNEVDDGLCLIY